MNLFQFDLRLGELPLVRLHFLFGVSGLGSGVWDWGVDGLGVGVQGSGFRVQGSGFRIQGPGFRVVG